MCQGCSDWWRSTHGSKRVLRLAEQGLVAGYDPEMMSLSSPTTNKVMAASDKPTRCNLMAPGWIQQIPERILKFAVHINWLCVHSRARHEASMPAGRSQSVGSYEEHGSQRRLLGMKTVWIVGPRTVLLVASRLGEHGRYL